MQITTISLFCFDTFLSKCWAFSQMGLAPFRLGKVNGLQFVKFLGSGGGNGFSIKPNFSQYGILAVWDSEASAEAFFKNNGVFSNYCKHSSRVNTFYLKNTMAHGAWDGKQPFIAVAPYNPDAPVAVITRATIRWRYLARFWRFVPGVSRDVDEREGLRLAVGIGELPLIQQATFSIWDTGRQMTDYAYKRPEHSAVIRKTRELGWYREELFARFEPYVIEGGNFLEAMVFPER